MDNQYPYRNNTRVLSDKSRFEYQKPVHDVGTKSHSARIQPQQRTIPDQSSSRYDTSDDPYNFYFNLPNKESERKEYTPYPTQGYVGATTRNLPYEELSGPPPPPPPSKDQTYRQEKPSYSFRNEFGKDNLPPMQDSRDYVSNLQTERSGAVENAFPYPSSGENAYLLGRVMDSPLFVLGHNSPQGVDQKYYYGYNVTASNILDFLQLLFGIFILILASVLTSKDSRIDSGYYQYFIAVGSITLVVALLFLTKSINFVKSHGVLYCLLACILSGVALIISITSIATNDNCSTGSICLMRKALSTFAILSFFLWMCNVVMFLTVLYVSKLDSNHDDVFEHGKAQKQGKNADPMYLNDNHSYRSDDTQVEKILDSSALPHYFLSSNGQLHTLESHHDIAGKNKVVVYM